MSPVVVIAAVGYGVEFICRRPRRVSIVFRETVPRGRDTPREGVAATGKRAAWDRICLGQVVVGVVERHRRGVWVGPGQRFRVGDGGGFRSVGEAARDYEGSARHTR